jgi:hypothetical protein
VYVRMRACVGGAHFGLVAVSTSAAMLLAIALIHWLFEASLLVMMRCATPSDPRTRTPDLNLPDCTRLLRLVVSRLVVSRLVFVRGWWLVWRAGYGEQGCDDCQLISMAVAV